jgi:uncharacterized protein
MSDLYVSWSEYHQKIEQLAVKIYDSGWHFQQILCLARGGLRAGDLVSRMFHKPLAILSTASYTTKGGQEERGSLTISGHITMTTPQLDAPLLIVDDLVDSGVTLQQTIPWLKEHYGIDPQHVKTAVLWCKACSVFTPDFYADFLPDSSWIHQPFERYETMDLAKLSVQSLVSVGDTSVS